MMPDPPRTIILGRFKPLHNVSALLLEKICQQNDMHADTVIVLGSTNKYDVRNPFTVQETKYMINAYLWTKGFIPGKSYYFREIPDYGHIPEYSDGIRWKEEFLAKIGNFSGLDSLVTDNPFVKELLKDTYRMIDPRATFLKDIAPLRSSLVRLEMVKGDAWKQFVPQEVAEFLETERLVERFRLEFGEETLKLETKNYHRRETFEEEWEHVKTGK